MAPVVFRCGELESEVRLPRNPIGQPGINGNRARRKHVIREYLDKENINLRSKYLRNRIDESKTSGSSVYGKMLLYRRSIASLVSYVRISSRNRSEGK